MSAAAASRPREHRGLGATGMKGWLVALAATAGAAGLVRIALGPGEVNYDSLYALVWGREIAHGRAPDYGVVLPPTPHPLSTIVGVLLAPLGSSADDALLVGAYLALGAVGVLAFALGRHWAGVAGGAVAAVLALTRDTTLFNGALAYFDVVF